jgi:hypothetical protein
LEKASEHNPMAFANFQHLKTSIIPDDSDSKRRVSILKAMRLPLSKIDSTARYAVYCKPEGLVSGHDQAREALRAMAAHVNVNPCSICGIYARTAESWVLIF